MKVHPSSVGIVLAALAAGWGVRVWRQQSVMLSQPATTHRPHSTHETHASHFPATEPPPLLAENPLRTQLTGILEMLTTLRTAEDCQRLLEALQRLPMDDYSIDALPVPVWELLFKKWTALDPAAALQATNAIPQRQLGSRMVQTVMESWVSRDRAGALAALRNLPDGWARSMGPRLVFSALGKSDPAGALQLIETLPAGAERDQHVASVLSGWAAENPQAAIAWVLALKDEKARMEHLEGIMRGGFQGLHPQLAWDTVVQNVTDPAQRKNMLGSMVMMAGQSHPADTLRRIQSLPAGEQAGLLYSLGEWTFNVRKDPQSAAELAALLPATGPARDAWTAGCARGFLIDGETPDCAAALALIAQLPAGDQRTSLLKEAGEVWAKRDAVTASQYFNTQAPGPDRDAMLGEYVRAHFPNDPEAALIWTTAITDPGKRDRRLTELLPKWHQQNAAAAEAWIQTSDRLTDDERTALLERAQAR